MTITQTITPARLTKALHDLIPVETAGVRRAINELLDSPTSVSRLATILDEAWNTQRGSAPVITSVDAGVSARVAARDTALGKVGGISGNAWERFKILVAREFGGNLPGDAWHLYFQKGLTPFEAANEHRRLLREQKPQRYFLYHRQGGKPDDLLVAQLDKVTPKRVYFKGKGGRNFVLRGQLKGIFTSENNAQHAALLVKNLYDRWLTDPSADFDIAGALRQANGYIALHDYIAVEAD